MIIVISINYNKVSKQQTTIILNYILIILTQFGGSAFVKEYLFGLKDYSKATFIQNFCASIGGAITSIIVAQPPDIVKTRIQNKPFDSPETGTQIIRKMMIKEGNSTIFLRFILIEDM